MSFNCGTPSDFHNMSILLLFPFSVYGDDYLGVLLGHFKGILKEANIDLTEAKLEWTAMKNELYDE